MCGQPVGAVEVGGAPAGQPPTPALPPSPHSNPVSANPGQPGFPPPPPGPESRRPWPAPEGAPAPATYPHAQQQQQQSESQWLWEEPTGPLRQGAPARPPAGTAPPAMQPSLAAPGPASASGIVQPTVIQPGAQRPGLPAAGSDPYGPPPPGAAPTAVQQPGGPQPWPQGPGGPQAPGENENTATMPGMQGFGPAGGNQYGGNQWGPGGGDQWGGPGGWPQQPGGPGRPGGIRKPALRVPHGPIVPAVGVAALIVVVAAVIAATRGGGSQQAGNTANPAPSASASAKPSSNPQEQQAATQLSQLLSQSGGDRGDVNHAYAAVQACQTLPADRAVFAKAAANRQNLLNKLGNLPDASALDPTMLQDLNGAWSASAQADTDYANWATSLEHDCKPKRAAKSPALAASSGADATATNDKQKFTGLWNPLAGKYGLSRYTPGQI